MRRQGQQGVKAVIEVNRLILQKALHTLKTLTFDIDATLSESKNKSAQWTYKKCKGSMPMVGHIAETGQIVAADFREGNMAPASQNLKFIRSCEAALPADITLALRIDAAGYQVEILGMCIDRQLKFAIRAKMSPSLKKQIQAYQETQRQPLLDAKGCPIQTNQHCGYFTQWKKAGTPLHSLFSVISFSPESSLVAHRVKILLSCT